MNAIDSERDSVKNSIYVLSLLERKKQREVSEITQIERKQIFKEELNIITAGNSIQNHFISSFFILYSQSASKHFERVKVVCDLRQLTDESDRVLSN